jgi:hypothetical protein
MYSINSDGKISLKQEHFTNSNINCNNINTKCINSNETGKINKDNFINNININCLTVPSKVFNGHNVKPFILSTVNRDCTDNTCSKGGHHSFQVFPFNLKNNDILVDTIKPNFFCIVNTTNMNADGNIILKNKNSKIKLIKLTDLNNNDNNTSEIDRYGNLCHNPNNKTTLSKFNYSQDQIINNTPKHSINTPKYSINIPKQCSITKDSSIYDSINNTPNQECVTMSYKGNPIIYFFGDYVACDYSQRNFVNNLFVYFDYGQNQNILSQCMKRMTFTKTKSGNIKQDFLLPYTMNGTEYIDTISRNFIINFDPRNNSYKDGFITIINTKNNNDTIENFQSNENNLYNLYITWKNQTNNSNVRDFLNNSSITENMIYDFIINYLPSENNSCDNDIFFKKVVDNFESLNIDSHLYESFQSSSQLTPQSSSQLTPQSSSQLTPQSSSQLTPQSSSQLTPQSSSQLTPQSSSELVGSIMFNCKLLNRIHIANKKSCLLINFYIVPFNFINLKIINNTNSNEIKGPYKNIQFIGNPKIIIYIPPYVVKTEEERMKVTELYQSDLNKCDIYVNITY